MRGSDSSGGSRRAHGRPPAALLFDLDGTLIATRRLYLESFADALEPEYGRRPAHDEMMARRPRAEVRFLRELGGAAAHPRVMERFYAAYDARHGRDFEGVYTGVPELLASLQAAGTPLGVVTGKSRRSWEITRRHTGLPDFPVSVFDDDVPAPKPDPAGLLAALERLGFGPDDTLYVGDSETDLEAAKRAGVRPAAALWSKRRDEVAPFAKLALGMGGVALETPAEVAALAGVPSPSPTTPRRGGDERGRVHDP